MFGDVHGIRTLRDDKRTCVFPREHVEVLTSTDLTQHGAKLTWASSQGSLHARDQQRHVRYSVEGREKNQGYRGSSVFKVKSSHRSLIGLPVPARSLKKGERLFVATEASLGNIEPSEATIGYLSRLTLAGLYTADGTLAKDGRHISIAAGRDTEVVQFLRSYGRERVSRDLSLTDKIALELQDGGYSHNIVRRLSEKYGCPRDLITRVSGGS